MLKRIASIITVSCLVGCEGQVQLEDNANAQGHTTPTAVTVKANEAFLDKRPFTNTQDFINARKGFIAQEPSLVTEHLQQGLVWNMPEYDFINADGEQPPASVNPSLWRQAALNNIHGLFEVTSGIYQVRGYDLANMTIIESDNGWIIVDPLTARETASKAYLFAQKHLGKKPLKAILFTHSHIDHFGGVQGVLQHLSDAEKDELQIIAPAGFEEEATSENIIAGTAMSRRAMYMYGKRLARNERGHVGTGLGKGPAFGTFGIEMPTTLIHETGTTLTVDGVPFVFQTVSGSEAPAEFTFYLPEHKAFCGAELVSNNMHNLYTLRGAKVRDARIWRPLWGKENINEFLIKQRDTYKFIHDQSVRMLNQGFTPNEIAENLQMPSTLNQDFHNQGYYGTLKHNAKAVYQNYLGWFTANPAKLDPLPEAQASIRYVEMMGGVERILQQAQTQFDDAANMSPENGAKTYRWLAELLNHAVFAEPDNTQAKGLLAKVYDQLGYQAESAPWRDFYLTGAYEFDSMSVRLIAEKAEGVNASVKITFTDLKESYLLSVNNSVLHHKKVPSNTQADATLAMTQPLFVDIIIGEAGLKDTLFGDDLSVEGSKLDLISFFSMLDKPMGTFNIVTP